MITSSKGIEALVKLWAPGTIFRPTNQDLKPIAGELNNEGESGSRALADLIRDLLACRSSDITYPLQVAGHVNPTQELIDAVRAVTEAPELTISPTHTKFTPEIVGDGKVGWTSSTHSFVVGLAKDSLSSLEKKQSSKENFSTEVSKTGKAFLTHVDKQVGYSIAFPESWKKMPESSDYLVGFEAPDEESSAGVSCNVVHERVPSEESLPSLFSQSMKQVEKELKGYNHISTEERTINKIPAISHVYHILDKKTEVQLMQIYMKQGEVWWVITFACTTEAFNSQLPVFEAIASSFQLLGSSKGDEATFKHSRAAMRADIGGWGIPLIIMGIIQIFVPVLDTVWGALLIAVGILDLIVRQRFLFIVTGLVIIIAGIMNLTAVPIFAILQFIWGGNEIRKYFKYESAEIEASDES